MGVAVGVGFGFGAGVAVGIGAGDGSGVGVIAGVAVGVAVAEGTDVVFPIDEAPCCDGRVRCCPKRFWPHPTRQALKNNNSDTRPKARKTVNLICGSLQTRS